MQDYNYIWHGCMEVTLELSCCKYPPATELRQFWDDNRASILQFLGEAHKGVKGFVKDERAEAIEGASMKVSKRTLFQGVFCPSEDGSPKRGYPLMGVSTNA